MIMMAALNDRREADPSQPRVRVNLDPPREELLGISARRRSFLSEEIQVRIPVTVTI